MSEQKELVWATGGGGGQTAAGSGMLATFDALFFLPRRTWLGALAGRQGYSRNT